MQGGQYGGPAAAISRPARQYGGGYGEPAVEWRLVARRQTGRLSDEDIRQLRDEARQYAERRAGSARHAARLQRRSEGARADPRGAAASSRTSASTRTRRSCSACRRSSTEGLKRLEFGLRRQVEAGDEAVVLAGSDEVPDQFRKMVAGVLPVARADAAVS